MTRSTLASLLTLAALSLPTLALAQCATTSEGGTGVCLPATWKPGLILFGNGTAPLATSPNLFWDALTARLGIGTTHPNAGLQIATSSAGNPFVQLSGSVYADSAGLNRGALDNQPTIHMTQGTVFWGFHNNPVWSVDTDMSGVLAFNNESNDALLTGSGNISSLFGLESHITNLSGGYTGTAGTWSAVELKDASGPLSINNYYGLRVGSFTAGSVANAGVLVGDMKGPGNNVDLEVGSIAPPSGNWGIYDVSSYPNYIKSSLGIGTTNPVSPLHVSAGAHATTTITIGAPGVSTSHACFNTKNTSGADISFYFASTTLVVEAHPCLP